MEGENTMLNWFLYFSSSVEVWIMSLFSKTMSFLEVEVISIVFHSRTCGYLFLYYSLNKKEAQWPPLDHYKCKTWHLKLLALNFPIAFPFFFPFNVVLPTSDFIIINRTLYSLLRRNMKLEVKLQTAPSQLPK